MFICTKQEEDIYKFAILELKFLSGKDCYEQN